MASLRGQFLIAAPQLVDPNFARAVVLILQHDENGAMGVIINRPLSISVHDACQQSAEVDCPIAAPLHAGGPCEGPLIALHGHGEPQQPPLLHGVWFDMERPKLERLFADCERPMKFIANYAGWGPGQLEMEMEEGAWLTVAASAETIFADAEGLWDTLLTRVTLGRWIDPSRIPDDPSMN